jgi:hypothetical protein
MQSVIQAQNEAPEVESVEAPSPPAPTLSQDADQTVKSFSFGGQVASLNLPSLETGGAPQIRAFFAAHQDETPTAISLAGRTAVFSYGDKHLRVDISQLDGMLKRGELAGDSRLVQSLIVARDVNALGLAPSQAGEITRSFVRTMQPQGNKPGMSPAKARVEAYTNATAALALGKDPKAQLEKDMGAVQGFFKNFQRLTGNAPDTALQTKLTDLMAKRMNAIANNNYAGAFDLQEQMRALASQHGLPPVGAPAADIPDAVNSTAEAADSRQTPAIEQEMTDHALKLLPGEKVEFESDGQAGFKVGLSVGVKVSVLGHDSPSLASVDAEAGARGLGKTKGALEREADGAFVVSYQRFVGGGVAAGISAKAIIELAAAEGAGDLGHMEQVKVKFATARDAARFLADLQNDDDLTTIENLPVRQLAVSHQEALGADPATQLTKDKGTVASFFQNFQQRTGEAPNTALQAKLESLLDRRGQAVASGDFHLAYTLQERARALASAHGMPSLGAPPVTHAAPTSHPRPGEFVVLEASSSVATHTESTVRHLAFARAAKVTAQGGSTLDSVRTTIPSSSNAAVQTDTTRFTRDDGAKIVERQYNHLKSTGSLLLKILTLGIYGKTQVRSDVGLSLRSVTLPSGLAKGQSGPTLPTTFNPDLSIQVDSGKVKACKDLKAVELLIEKQFDRTLAVMQTANKDAPGTFDLSEDGQMYLKESVRKGFMLVYNELNRTGHLSSERQVSTASDRINHDIGLTVAGTGGGIGWTSGGMVTVKIPFRGAPGTPMTAHVGEVEVGHTSKSAARWKASVGIDTGVVLPGPLSFEAGVHASGSTTQTQYQQVVGRATVPNPPLKPPGASARTSLTSPSPTSQVPARQTPPPLLQRQAASRNLTPSPPPLQRQDASRDLRAGLQPTGQPQPAPLQRQDASRDLTLSPPPLQRQDAARDLERELEALEDEIEEASTPQPQPSQPRQPITNAELDSL